MTTKSSGSYWISDETLSDMSYTAGSIKAYFDHVARKNSLGAQYAFNVIAEVRYVDVGGLMQRIVEFRDPESGEKKRALWFEGEGFAEALARAR